MKEMVTGAAGRVGLVGGSVLALFMGSLVLAGAASAAPGDDPVLDAFDTLNGKVTTYGAAIVALVVAATVLFFGIKFMRKGANKV